MTNNILDFWKSQNSDDPLEPFFAAAPVMMHSIDSEGTLVKVSRFWADKLGYRPEEMVGRKSTAFLTKASQEHAAEILPVFFEAGSIHNVDYDCVCANGTILPVLMSAIAEYDSEGRYSRSLAVMFDNTEAKRSAAELRQKHRMDAIGSLVGGIAHDFNNLLAVMLGNLEFLKMNPDDPDREEFIDSAMEAVKRGAALTQQLLSYGQRSRLSPLTLDLNDTLTGMSRMVRRLYPSSITLRTVPGDDLWSTEVDHALFETAVLNILNNARDAMPEGGRITMETHNVSFTEDCLDARAETIAAGDYVMLAITDTGPGMGAETLARIFEPFFTTKPTNIGSGLGLAMVFGFMRQSKGTIRAYSEPGVGTSFKLFFPATRDVYESKPLAAEPSDWVCRGETILLAEDEDRVRKVIARQLTNAGFRVIECSTGDQALDRLEGGVVPDLLVTDLVMPGLAQGPDLAAKARERHPNIKVVYLSGYPIEAEMHGGDAAPADRHLIKPIGNADLMRAIAAVLSDR